MTRVRILIALMMLFGCVPSAPQTIWKKDGATDGTYQADSYACEKDARQSGYFGTGMIGAVSMKNFYERCMFAQGWRLETLPQAKNFTAQEWDQVTSDCRTRAERISQGGGGTFPTAFQSCMTAHGF
jgi:hypothetical protein